MELQKCSSLNNFAFDNVKRPNAKGKIELDTIIRNKHMLRVLNILLWDTCSYKPIQWIVLKSLKGNISKKSIFISKLYLLPLNMGYYQLPYRYHITNSILMILDTKRLISKAAESYFSTYCFIILILSVKQSRKWICTILSYISYADYKAYNSFCSYFLLISL